MSHLRVHSWHSFMHATHLQAQFPCTISLQSRSEAHLGEITLLTVRTPPPPHTHTATCPKFKYHWESNTLSTMSWTSVSPIYYNNSLYILSPSWYYLKCYQDLNPQQTTNHWLLFLYFYFDAYFITEDQKAKLLTVWSCTFCLLLLCSIPVLMGQKNL